MAESMESLDQARCVPCEGGVPALSDHEARALLKPLEGWKLSQDGKVLLKAYAFPDFASALRFLNAVAFIAENEGHHPDIELGWGRCQVCFTTHAIGGLSLNDFICATKVEALASPVPA